MNSADQSNRVIRVFISSTFRDMMRERDILVKEVFPELRRKCAKRFVTFTEVDLRWGITEAQANEGQVLPLCLAEIERSRPYFIGLLGERYGWIPDAIRPELIEREPWLKEHAQGRTSVTELEILHGVFNNPKMESHAFFYFRDPSYVNDPTLTDNERWDIVEHDIRADQERYGPTEATRRTAERKAKLAALKQHIRDSKLPLVENYADPKALAEIIRRQFNDLIDRLCPEEYVPDPLAQERLAHEAHAKNKLFACIDRPAHLDALNAFAVSEQDGRGLVVAGDSGGGKTALLAAWARDWKKNHPEDFLFQHYFGATAKSASADAFLGRLLGELKSHFGIAGDVPADPKKLRDALPDWLDQIKGKGRVILMLDGLNQIQGSELDRRLYFLPRKLPRYIIAFASSLSGLALDALRERGWTEHELPPASEIEVNAMVGEYLKIHARTLDPELRNQLISAPGAKNPLFLRTVLEELRQFGSFKQLPERVRRYIDADNPKDLFLRVITRWQEDFDGKHWQQDNRTIDLVRRALVHLWAARQGLSEPEWLDLLGDGSQPLPRALWTPLFLALEPQLILHVGLYTFGHDFLRQAVETAFVPSEDLQKAAHVSVTEYFKHQSGWTTRKLEELPWQFAKAGLFDDLEKTLTNVDAFLGLSESNRFEIWSYWQAMPPGRRSFEDAYKEALEKWEGTLGETPRFEFALNELAFFHIVVARDHLVGAQLSQRSYRLAQKLYSEKDIRMAVRTNNLATALFYEGKFSEAAALLKNILPVLEGHFGLYEQGRWAPSITLGNCLSRLGRFEEAENLTQQAVASMRQYLGALHAQTLEGILLLATIIQLRGRFSEATPLFEEVARGRKAAFGTNLPDTKNAMGLLESHLSQFVNVSASRALMNLAVELEGRGINNDAITQYRDAFNILEKESTLDDPAFALCLRNLIILLENSGQSEEANKFAAKLLGSDRKLSRHWFPDTAVGCNNLGIFYRENGRLDYSELLLQQALDLDENSQPPNSAKIPHRLNNLCTVLVMQGKLDMAKRLLIRAWNLQSGQHDLTSLRVLFVFLAVALLQSQPVEALVGKLKTLLALEPLPDHAEVVKIWNIVSFTENLRPKLSPDNADFLTALAAALYDRAKLLELEKFPIWQESGAKSLE